MRATIPALPDFTSLAWHRQKQDARLAVAILEGKGKAMPPFQERMDAKVATDLVVYLRSLAGLKPAPAQDPLAEFDAQFRKLMAQLEALKRDYHALTMQGSTRRASLSIRTETVCSRGSSNPLPIGRFERIEEVHQRRILIPPII